MSSTAFIPVFLLLLGCLFRCSGAVCPGCLEFETHLDWCQYMGQPITGSVTGHQQSINSPHWQVQSGTLSPLSSSAQPGLVTGSPSASSSASVTICRHCGRSFKNSHGLAIHVGRLHRDKNNTKELSQNTIDFTSLPTQQTTDRVATVTTTELLSTSTLKSTSTQALTPLHSPAGTAMSSCARGVRLRKPQPIKAVVSTKETIMCVCGFKAVAFIGLKSHMRSCTVAKRLATGQPARDLGHSPGKLNQSESAAIDKSVLSRPTGLPEITISADEDKKLDVKNTHFNENNLTQDVNIDYDDKFNKSNNRPTSGNSKINNPLNITQDIITTNTNVDDINYCSSLFSDNQGKKESVKSEPLRPLLGVPLPKTESAWREMNLHFHISPLFRFAVGKIENLDLAVTEFNESIYNFLKGKYGTLKGKDKINTRGNPDFDIKYQNWSRSRIRRELSKLKSRGPVIGGSSLCDEIQYLSHRLRLLMASRPQAARPVTDIDFQTGFWPTCQKIFLDVAGALPTFSITECGAYFLKVLSIPDSLRSCIFQTPSWFVSLPPLTIPFDLSAPTYAEIASIIKKARAGSSACPLDQISVISLKKCPILRTILHNIIANCWQSQYTPKAWRVGVTILLYKKGDPSKVDNFRPITLQSVPYKIFSSFIRNRLQAYLDKNKYHNNNIQKGFAHGQDGVL